MAGKKLNAFPYGILGTLLSTADQQKALRCYVHRFTKEHIPDWALTPAPNGLRYKVQFESDHDWLAHTRFPTINGKLCGGDCYSTPTWPDGQWDDFWAPRSSYKTGPMKPLVDRPE